MGVPDPEPHSWTLPGLPPHRNSGVCIGDFLDIHRELAEIMTEEFLKHW